MVNKRSWRAAVDLLVPEGLAFGNCWLQLRDAIKCHLELETCVSSASAVGQATKSFRSTVSLWEADVHVATSYKWGSGGVEGWGACTLRILPLLSAEAWIKLGDIWPYWEIRVKMATHPSIVSWRNPWTEELGGPQSMGLQSRKRLSTHADAVICRVFWGVLLAASLRVWSVHFPFSWNLKSLAKC